jgi:hypothetical protein
MLFLGALLRKTVKHKKGRNQCQNEEKRERTLTLINFFIQN